MAAMHVQVMAELGAALAAGGLIGAERSYHGRAAGFRTHALAALGAAAAVLVAAAPGFAPGIFPAGTPRLDPSRLAQGVMTGVGFLGAGVIFKEGVNVQGLTTAASIYATAAIGLLFGVGEFYTGALTTGGVLLALIVMRWIEDALPAQVYAWAALRFRIEAAPSRAELATTLARFGVALREASFARTHDGALFEFSGALVAKQRRAYDELAAHLRELPGLTEFELRRISK